MKLAIKLALSCVAAALMTSPASAFWWHHHPVVVVNVGGAPVSGAYAAGAATCHGHYGHFGHHAPVVVANVGAPVHYGAVNYGAPGAPSCGGYGAAPSCTGGYGAAPSCTGGFSAPPPPACPADKKTTLRMQQIDRKLDELLAAVRTGTAPLAKGRAAAPDGLDERARAWQKDDVILAERIRRWQDSSGTATAGSREPVAAPVVVPAAGSNLPALTRGPNP